MRSLSKKRISFGWIFFCGRKKDKLERGKNYEKQD